MRARPSRERTRWIQAWPGGALERRWPIPSRGEALKVGGAWLGLTVAFEFEFGRLGAKPTWRDLLADYSLAAGRTWPLVLDWIAAGPAVVRELRR